jgi:hypothetical protein
LEAIDGLTISEPAVNNFQKLIKLNVFVLGLKIVDKVVNYFVSSIEAQLLEYFLYLFGINFSAVVFIKQIEGCLKLLDFLLRETLSGRDYFRLYFAVGEGFLSHC